MKKSKKLILTIVTSVIMIFTAGQAVSAQEVNTQDYVPKTLSSNGPNDSHEQFVGQALKIIENDKGSNAVIFYNDNKKLLLEYCDKPDSDEADYAFAYHFYNPYTNKNYLPAFLSASKITAMTKFKEHMGNAVESYNSNKTYSMEQLGRAIHFLTDVNVPHHASNMIAGLSSHSQYEKYISKNNSLFFVNTSDAYDKYSDYSFDQYCTEILNECAKNAYSYKAVCNSYDSSEWEKAARPTLKLAQENIASLLYRFEKEVSK
ncbi:MULTISPECIES: zinc dependent phospholipase C family protein [Clostridium]|uniref:Phospholipase C n=1 Tax=Clostridium cibarium TaxID=2762247 RepID=A0ABR8PYA2_9CLOT|nr:MULTISPECIES: zinc dependent phospholipase C family protein [Clostridium]MBD7913139.1 zinc dependent phospholipase C family protein [Clostridium cibarium]